MFDKIPEKIRNEPPSHGVLEAALRKQRTVHNNGSPLENR